MALRAFADGSLFAESFGDHPPRVLALHGWGRRGSDFVRSLQGIDALAPDLPGFGASPAPARAVGAHGYAEMLRPVLEQFAAPPVVVGHSFGGRVAVCLASRYPVAALVLTGVPLLRIRPPARIGAGYRLARALNRRGLVSDRQMEIWRRRSGSSDYRSVTGVMRQVLVTVVDESYQEELARIEVPVRMLWGSDDTEAPLEVARAAEEILGRAGGAVSLRVLPGSGHMLPLEQPAALRAEILEALS